MDIQSIRPVITDPDALAWLSWIGIGLGVLGVALSYYFYIKGLRTKRPYCLTFTHVIAGRMLMEVPEFRITYRGRPVPRLAITKLVFWNAGSDTINSTDVPAAARFCISIVGSGEFLNHNLDFVKKSSNAIALSIDGDKKFINVKFDYFDKNDGFVVELLHTGESDSSIRVESTFKGAHPLVRRSAAPLLSLPRPIRRLLASEERSAIGFILVTSSILAMAHTYIRIFPSWVIEPTQPPTTVPEWIAFAAVYGSFLLLGAYLFRTRLPAGFNLNW
jgi:hypothetical protein